MPTTPTTEAGKEWLECIEYTGPGAKDPTGGILPHPFQWTDLAGAAKVLRSRKIVSVPIDRIRATDKIISAVIDEVLVEELYSESPDSIILKNASGKDFSRLGWYKTYGRDGLRVLVTGRLKLGRTRK